MKSNRVSWDEALQRAGGETAFRLFARRAGISPNRLNNWKTGWFGKFESGVPLAFIEKLEQEQAKQMTTGRPWLDPTFQSERRFSVAVLALIKLARDNRWDLVATVSQVTEAVAGWTENDWKALYYDGDTLPRAVRDVARREARRAQNSKEG